MTSEREKFFRRRLLFKLYPCEDGTETDSDASDQEEMSVKTTECNVYMNASVEGRTRMQSEEKGREQGSSQQACQVEQDKQNDVATPLRSFASVKKLPEAESTDQSPSAKFVTGNIGAENSESKSVDTSNKASKPSKNQKRKMKKKRRKERLLSKRTKETTASNTKEFTCETHTYQTS